MVNYKAQKKIADILLNEAGDTAYKRLVNESRFAKQSPTETAMRIAGNLLQSLVTRKPDGFVELPKR